MVASKSERLLLVGTQMSWWLLRDDQNGSRKKIYSSRLNSTPHFLRTSSLFTIFLGLVHHVSAAITNHDGHVKYPHNDASASSDWLECTHQPLRHFGCDLLLE